MTGIILAGGNNSRIGRDKSFLKVAGRPVIERILHVLRPLFEDIVIVTNNPSLYIKYGVRIMTDVVKGRGPLGGIYSGLLFSNSPHNFCVACDMPFINKDLIIYMKEQINNADILIPRSEVSRQPFTFGKLKADNSDVNHSSMIGLQPLHAIYSRKCVSSMRMLLENGYPRMSKLLSMVNVKYIPEKETKKFDPHNIVFYNINVMDDLKTAKEIAFLYGGSTSGVQSRKPPRHSLHAGRFCL
jgi:molybdopterin-guanine dinucleotide biosynthesis protein A